MRQYFTDEELTAFIEDIEQEPLYAPAHLKEEILSRAGSLADSQSVCRIDRQEDKPEQKRKRAQVQMFTYSLKITAGMIAALILLYIIPHENSFERSYQAAEKSSMMGDALKRGTQAVNDTTVNLLDKINTLKFETEDNNYENEKEK